VRKWAGVGMYIYNLNIFINFTKIYNQVKYMYTHTYIKYIYKYYINVFYMYVLLIF